MTTGRLSSRRGVLRATLAALGFVTVSIVGIGALHMPWGRPLLMQIGGCPIETDPLAIERAQRDGALARRGEVPAPTRIAHGFRLGQDGPADVEAWARARGGECESQREGLWLACPGVAGSSVGMLGALGRVDFVFRSRDQRLVSVSAYQEAPERSSSAASFETAAAALRAAFGEPSFRGGEPRATQAYATATLAYRYEDVVIDLTTTQLPSRGSTVLESIVLATD
jgi:hypothetical protein